MSRGPTGMATAGRACNPWLKLAGDSFKPSTTAPSKRLKYKHCIVKHAISLTELEHNWLGSTQSVSKFNKKTLGLNGKLTASMSVKDSRCDYP